MKNPTTHKAKLNNNSTYSKESNKLDASVPANNQKIIELFNKIKKGELDPSPKFQRKLVWKKQHKIKFIDTILNNYPFPEVYLAPDPDGVDLTNITLRDLIVDGQQRLTTISNYIESLDVFATEEKLGIPKFSELSNSDKTQFLSYDVSVRYLKNATNQQINDVFQRINSTEYALNKIERTNAQWGESEFIYFSKQLIEKPQDFDAKNAIYKLSVKNRSAFVKFFNEEHEIFTENDTNRMLALQYIMTLLATLCEQTYFNRNDKTDYYVESYFDTFIGAGELEEKLRTTIDFINSLKLVKSSYWFNKSNTFTLICELFPYDVAKINPDAFRSELMHAETLYREYYLSQQSKRQSQFVLFDLTTQKQFNIRKDIPAQYYKYFEFAREGVNNKASRDFRGNVVKEMISKSLIPTLNSKE